MTQTKKCPKCGGTKYYNEGISKKTGNAYANWKCGQCKDIEWVELVGGKPVKAQKEPDWDEIRARKENGMEFLNAKNNAALLLAAAIRKGEKTLEQALDEYESITFKIFRFQNAGEENV